MQSALFRANIKPPVELVVANFVIVVIGVESVDKIREDDLEKKEICDKK